MTDRLIAFVAILAFAGFLGILIWEVPRPGLGVVIAITLLLVLLDVLRSSRDPRR